MSCARTLGVHSARRLDWSGQVDAHSFFAVGRTYRHLSGSYEVVEIDGDWLVCALDDGRQIRVTAVNAYRVLEQLGMVGDVAQPVRLDHSCSGRPCGSACVKNIAAREGTRE